MAYFVHHKAENPAESYIELIAESEAAHETARHAVYEVLVEQYTPWQDRLSMTDVETVFKSDFKHLPAEVAARVFTAQEDPIPPILDSCTNLGAASEIWMPSDCFLERERDWEYAVLSYSIEENEDAKDLQEDSVFQQLIKKHGFTRYAYQFEPLPHAQLREHSSLGRIDENGYYIPVLTILSREHPVRQLIDASIQVD